MKYPSPADSNRHRTSLSLFVAAALALALYRVGVIEHLGLDPYVDEAYYWSWTQSLDWGYYSKPPLIAGLLAWSGWLFGDGLLALKVPSLLLYPATAFVVRRLGRELFDERVGFWSGVAFLTLPATAALSLFTSTDAPLLFFWAVGMLLLWRALTVGSLPYWLGTGLVVGLGLMSKYAMLAFAGSAALVVLAHREAARLLVQPGPWLAGTLALAIFAPNLWWNWQHGFPTFEHTAEITRLGARVWSPAELVEFVAAQWLMLGPLLMAFLLWALICVRETWAETRFRFLLGFTMPLLAVTCVQALTGRANGNWAAPAFVAGTIVAVAFMAGRGRWHLVMFAVALNTVAGVAVYHWPDMVRLAGRDLEGRLDPYKRARGWQDFTDAVRPHLVANPAAVLVADDRELLAQLVYGLRPNRYARWQGSPHVVDHFGLTKPFTAASGDTVLFVSAREEAGAVGERFATAKWLGDVDVEVYSDFHRRASVWLLQGFKGY